MIIQPADAYPGTFRLRLPPGIMIRDPETGRLAEDGLTYPRTTFWTRLLASGEVGEQTEPEDDHAAAPAAPRSP